MAETKKTKMADTAKLRKLITKRGTLEVLIPLCCTTNPVRLDFDVLDGWDHELSQMNLGKVGEPYCYPDSFIQLLGHMRAYFHLPYKQTQGVVIAHANKIPNTPHYSTISRRINRLEIKINEKLGNDIVIALG
ncbi:MAG: transposase, partial [Candidatus Nitrosopolaris sp.]